MAFSREKNRFLATVVAVVDSYIQRIVLATEEDNNNVTQQVSHRLIKCQSLLSSLAREHKEVRRSTGHIMVTARYLNRQGSKSRQNPCQVQPIENIINKSLSASRRRLWVRTTVSTVEGFND